MILMSLEEFKQQTTPGANSLEKNYQGKSFKAGPVFSLNSSKAAQSYCEKLDSQNRTFSILVKDKDIIQVWTEISAEKQSDYVSSKFIVEEDEISVNSLIVEAEFVKFCQKKLAIYIGPIAKMICKKALANNSNLTRIEFVEILAQKISDPDQILEFKAEMLE